MDCPNCFRQNPGSAIFCYKCGTSLAAITTSVGDGTGVGTAKAPEVVPASKAEIADDPKAKKTIGGWLGLFIFACIVGTPLQVAVSILSSEGDDSLAQVAEQFPRVQTINIVENIGLILMCVLSIYTGIILWRVKPNAIRTARVFLLVVICFQVLDLGLLMLAGLPPALTSIALAAAMPTVVRSLIFCAVWLTYFGKSRRVRETYFSA
jgi:hypothetical protein